MKTIQRDFKLPKGFFRILKKCEDKKAVLKALDRLDKLEATIPMVSLVSEIESVFTSLLNVDTDNMYIPRIETGKETVEVITYKGSISKRYSTLGDYEQVIAEIVEAIYKKTAKIRRSLFKSILEDNEACVKLGVEAVTDTVVIELTDILQKLFENKKIVEGVLITADKNRSYVNFKVKLLNKEDI